MDNSEQQFMQFTRLATAVGLGIVALIAWLIVLIVGGYGTLSVDMPSNTAIYLNGHHIEGSSVRLRPGTYTVATTSARYYATYNTVKVGLFSDKTYRPNITERDPNSILNSTIGANGLFGRPQLSDIGWFHNYTWLTGVVGPGSSSFIALEYKQSKWQVAYYDASSDYPQNLGALPADVSASIASLKANHPND